MVITSFVGKIYFLFLSVGDLRVCSSYRGIMLLSVPSNVLNRVWLERMRETVDPSSVTYRHKSCTDQIASLFICNNFYINFTCRQWESLPQFGHRDALEFSEHYGIPEKMIASPQPMLISRYEPQDYPHRSVVWQLWGEARSPLGMLAVAIPLSSGPEAIKLRRAYFWSMNFIFMQGIYRVKVRLRSKV